MFPFHICPIEIQMAADALKPFIIFLPTVLLWWGAIRKEWL